MRRVAAQMWALVVAALTMGPIAASAQQAVCPGASVPLNTSVGGTPFVNMRLGGHEGYFSIDTGAAVSLVDAETFALAARAKQQLTGSSLPTVEAGTFMGWDLRYASAPSGRLIGIIGTDFLSLRVVEFHFDTGQPFMVISLQPCPEQKLKDGGFIPIDQKGYYSSDPKRLLPGIANWPIIYSRIGNIISPVMIDSGMRDLRKVRLENFINSALLQRLRGAGISMQAVSHEMEATLTGCSGKPVSLPGWQLDAAPLSFTTADGEPLFLRGPPRLNVRPPDGCGGIADQPSPWVMTGALEMLRWGAIVLDGRNDRIWVKKNRSPGSPYPLYQAMALAWNDVRGGSLQRGDTVEDAQAKAMSNCNQVNGDCRIISQIPPTEFGCLAMATDDKNARINMTIAKSFEDARRGALDQCAKTSGNACTVKFNQCNDQ